MDNPKTQLTVLCLEDNLNDIHLIKETLTNEGFILNFDNTASKKEYHDFLKHNKYDIILADFTLPGFDIYTALKMARELQPDVPFICVSGTKGEDTAVELLKLGATDYILKDKLGRLGSAVRRALHEIAQQKEWNITNKAL